MFTPEVIKEVWSRGWPVMSILLSCSVTSGAIILERLKTIKKASFDRDAFMGKVRKLLKENRREQALAYCESMNKPVGRVTAAILEASVGDTSRDLLDRMADRHVRAEVAELGRFTTGLGTIGSMAPFIGLFGTVIGIIQAFRSISQSGSGGPSVVAAGISEALVATALGLFVAIPAIVAYNLLTKKIELIGEDIELCAEEVIDLLPRRP